MAGSNKTASRIFSDPAPAELGRNDIPNGRLLLEAMGLSHERLNAGSKIKVPVPAAFLKELMVLAATNLPFDESFYLATYPDVREAIDQGRVSSARAHFIERGFLEGRFGSKPDVDEGYYKNIYPDVAEAVRGGNVPSALEHYMRAGAFEGRFPSRDGAKPISRWLTALGK
jgi:hypothetical protein